MSRIAPDYEQMGALAASYMLAPVQLGPELEDKVTALGAGTGNPSGSGIPLFVDRSKVDYIRDEASLRPKPSHPMPLSIAEGDEYAKSTPEDDRARIMAAIQRDKMAMAGPEFHPEIGVVPVSEMSRPGDATEIRVSDFSAADVFRPPVKTGKRPDIVFVDFAQSPMSKPYAKV